MKHLIYLFFVLLFGSCAIQENQKNPATIQIDNLHALSISLPKEFDKNFESVCITDYSCQIINKGFVCSEKHNLPIVDTINTYRVIDNIAQPKACSFTVSFYKNRKCNTDPDINQERLAEIEQIQMVNNVTTKVLIKTLEKINDLDFLIFGYQINQNSTCIEVLQAETKIDNIGLTISFDRISSDSTNFVGDMYKVLRTIKTKTHDIVRNPSTKTSDKF